MSKNHENQQKNEEKKDQIPVNPEPEKPEETPVEEKKPNLIDRGYNWYCGRRTKKEEKKKNKKERSKGEKAALITGGVVLGGSVLLGLAKSFVDHYADMADSDDEGDETEDGNQDYDQSYPTDE